MDSTEKLDEESLKRQKLYDDTEKAKLKESLNIVTDEDEVIDITPLYVRAPITD